MVNQNSQVREYASISFEATSEMTPEHTLAKLKRIAVTAELLASHTEKLAESYKWTVQLENMGHCLNEMLGEVDRLA